MELAMIGLGKMGGNMALRLLRDGHRVVAYARSKAKGAPFVEAGAQCVYALEEVPVALEKPRVVWLMVPAGVVGNVLEQLVPFLDEGDIVVDGGNIELPSPTLVTGTYTNVLGLTGSRSIVELFSDEDGEGQWFEMSVEADGDGVFTATQPGGFRGPKVTGTATDADGNTSEFCAPPIIISPPPKKLFLPIVLKEPRSNQSE